MRTRVLLISVVLFAVAATPASAATGRALPSWFTKSFNERVHNAGATGVRVGEERLNTECPGVQTAGVSAAGCIVAPAGCTANFIYTDGSSQYVGTARHCVDRVGQELVMQVDSTTLASVGTVARMTSGEGEPGNDVAIIRIDPAVAAKWGVNPAVPVVGGPQGIYTGCDPTPVVHYGHGYGVLVGPGKLEGGLATNWHDDGYGWTGFGAPGDSGSPVVTASGQAAGNFTHLIVDTGEYLGSTLAGMRITRILQTMGVRLVNADGSTTGAASTNCG
jgi:S1-C subfamily serine protease